LKRSRGGTVPSTAVSRRLAEVMATTRYDDLPPAVISDAKRSILDWLGSCLAGSIEKPARIAQQIVASLGDSDDATVFNAGRSSAVGAALANGVASHILELDDVHKGSTLHAAAPIIPAALAVAEREGASGKDFILAVVLGYDAALRIGEAVNPDHYKFFHPTGTAATFGAAVAAGSLIGLDASRMLDALGTAGTQAAGLWEFNAAGAMSKHLHPGKAAMNGVLAADLAKAGFTGASRILEGDRGFFRATAAHSDPSRITDRLGEHWKISENCFKIHSCCGHTHSAVDVMLDLREKIVHDGSFPEEITVETYAPGYEIVKEMDPRTPYEAKFSLAYCVSAAFVAGSVGLQAFDFDHPTGPGPRVSDIRAFLPHVKVVVADDLTAKYPAAWPTRLTVKLDDGKTLHGSADYPRGNPENPVSTAELEEKFKRLVWPFGGLGLATTFAQMAMQVDQSRHMRSDFAEPIEKLLTTAVPHRVEIVEIYDELEIVDE
jgi:2-methylcitrate dehydratase PrpD